MRAGHAAASAVLMMVALFAGTRAARAQVGPSFPCPQPNDPLANLICSSSELSHDDLKMVQSYQTLRFSLPTSGQDELTQESIAFTESVTAGCGIPPVGSVLPAPPSAIPCVDQRYRQQRDVYAARLTGTPAQEANRPLAQHIALQHDLQILGFLPSDATIDGDYGPMTRTAIENWQQSHGITVTGFIGDADATMLERDASPRVEANGAGLAQQPNVVASPSPPSLSPSHSVAPATSPPQSGVAACWSIDDATQRLTCYDQKTGRPEPTRPAALTVLGSWPGEGQRNTPPFHASGPWELRWVSSDSDPIIAVYTVNGSVVSQASGASDGQSYEPGGGDFYLNVDIDGPWQIEALPYPPGSMSPLGAAPISTGQAAQP